MTMQQSIGVSTFQAVFNKSTLLEQKIIDKQNKSNEQMVRRSLPGAERQFFVGDSILVRRPTRKKSQSVYIGPFLIERFLSNRRVKLSDGTERRIEWLRHFRRGGS